MLHEKVAHLDSMNSIAMRLAKIETAAKSIAKMATGGLKDVAKNAAREAAEKAKDAASEAAEKARDAASEAAEKAKDAASEAAEKAKDASSEAAEKARDTASEAVEKAKGPNGAASVMGSGGGAAMSTEATVVPPAAASVRSQVARPDKEAPAPQTDVARGGEEEATGTALQVPAPRTGEEANLQLQLMLRTSIERRYAHDWIGTQLHRLSNYLQVVGLIGGTIAYLCLFFSLGDELGTSTAGSSGGGGDGGGSGGDGFESCGADTEGDVRCVLRQIGEALTIGLAGIGYVRVMGGFDDRAAKHDAWRGKFASVARDAAMLLAVDELDEQLCEVPKLQQRIGAIGAPTLPAFLLKRIKAKKGNEEGLPPGALIYQVLSGEERLTGAPIPEAAPEEEEEPEEQAAASWDLDTRRELKALKLDASVREIAARFNATFENMPDLPERMPTRYKHISMAVNLSEARRLAPLTHVSHPKPSEGERLLSVLVGMYARALELSYAHQGQARQHKAALARVQTSIILVAGLISIALLLGAPLLAPSAKGYVDIGASILAACLSLANAWTKFARYEQG